MDDETWRKLRRRLAINRAATVLAWVCGGLAFGVAVVHALFGRTLLALTFFAIAVVAFFVARWEPPLISIDDTPEDEVEG